MPFGHMPYGRSIGPRVGLLGLFPLLCFGGFFFLLVIWGLGFFARRRAWMHYGPGAYPQSLETSRTTATLVGTGKTALGRRSIPNGFQYTSGGN